jgi:hypothetical protein
VALPNANAQDVAPHLRHERNLTHKPTTKYFSFNERKRIYRITNPLKIVLARPRFLNKILTDKKAAALPYVN